MGDDDLNYMSAFEAARCFRERTLSPVDLLEALIERAEAISDTINPFGDCYFDEARWQAREAEKAFMGGGADPAPLAGVPLAVKDSARIAGRKSAKGSMVYRDHVDEVTDPGISRLLEAGAILFARTTMPEFGWLYTTHSRLWGVTNNPWRHGISPGGSSGGSAAALAAGAATIATGGDSTGSIRQPASQCGVVGWQAPFGRIPMPGPSSFAMYLHHGPMTRSVKDAAWMANLMSGPHPLDHNSLADRVTVPEDPDSIAGMKIAFSIDLGCYEVTAEVERQTRLALTALEDAGAIITEVPVDWAEEAIRLGHGGQEFLAADAFAEILEKYGDIVSDYMPELVATTRRFTASDYRRSLDVAGEVWNDHLGPLFERHDAFITPTVSCPHLPATAWQQDTINVNGKDVTDTQTAMTVLWNMFGHSPVLAVPSGLTADDLPTGIQVIGRPFADGSVFRIGHVLEERRPWLDCPERRPVLALS